MSNTKDTVLQVYNTLAFITYKAYMFFGGFMKMDVERGKLTGMPTEKVAKIDNKNGTTQNECVSKHMKQKM